MHKVYFCKMCQNVLGFLIISFLFVFNANAQTRITTPNPILRYDTKYITLDNDELRKLDSNNHNFHRYNVTEKQSVPYYNLGNYGTAYYPLMFQYNRNIGFSSGYNSFDLYKRKKLDIQFFDTKTPYTDLDFIFGAKEEITGGADFSMNVNPQLNFGLYYRRNSFKGQAKLQESVYNNFSLNNWYRSKSNRYEIKSAFLFNNIKNQENGGWTVENIYNDAIYKGKKNKQFADVNLQTATQKYTEKNVFFIQYIHFGKKEIVEVNDSTKQTKITPKYTLEHEFSYKKETYLFKNYKQDSAFFQHHYLSTDSTHDATKTWNISNSLAFKNVADSTTKIPFLYKVGVQLDLIKYKQFYNNKFVTDIKLFAEIKNKNKQSKLQYFAKAMIDIAPKYIGDFEVNLGASYFINKEIAIELINKIQHRTPSEKENFLVSNHFLWQNNFKKIVHNQTNLVFNWPKQKFYINLENHILKNYIYYDTATTLQQYNKNLIAFNVQFRKDFEFKNFYIGNAFWVQFFNNKDIIKLPTFAMLETFYYKGGWISGKLNAHLGVNISYNTNFNSPKYQPALAEFYIQNTERMKFYPILDVFFNLYVSKTTIFMRLEHANQGMFKQKGIYTSPNYGYLDRTFRVGVNWQFYD